MSWDVGAKNWLPATWSVKASRYSFATGIVDIVAQKEDEDLLVIVEVKTRRNERFGDASLAVTPQKIRSIIIATNAFVKTYQVHSRIRFDIITIVGTHAETAQVRHVEDVPLM